MHAQAPAGNLERTPAQHVFGFWERERKKERKKENLKKEKKKQAYYEELMDHGDFPLDFFILF